MPKPARGASIRAVTFVNLTHPDDIHDHNVQASIRRHVAGDVGRARRKARRNPVVTLEFRPQTTPGQEEPRDLEPNQGDEHSQSEPNLATLSRDVAHPSPSWPVNSYGILGVRLDARALKLVHFMSAESEYSHRAFSTTWIRIGLTDGTAFLLSLAGAAMARDRVYGLPTRELNDNAESVEYYSESMRQLSRRLSDPVESTSPGVVASVLGCMCHDVTVGNWRRWAVHMDGLARIRKLRGGLDGLENGIPIMAAWLDMAGSAYFDAPPRFNFPHQIWPADENLGEPPPALAALLHRLKQLHPELSPFVEAMLEMATLAETVNQHYRDLSFWRNEQRALGLLGPVIHRFLSLPRLDQTSKPSPDTLVVSEMIRLVCLMLIAELKTRFSLNAADRLPLREKFLALEPKSVKISGEGLLGLKLWVLVTFGLLQSKEDRRTVLPHIRSAASEISIAGAANIVGFAKNLLWIEILEQPAEDAWLRDISADCM